MLDNASDARLCKVKARDMTFFCLQLEKALLLCALLNGFGMAAYVCSGTVSHKNAPPEPRQWCMTMAAPDDVTFWDPVSGKAI